jgi:gamma-glutamylcysteine synthetase
MRDNKTIGLEMEMAVVNKDNGQSHFVAAEYFGRLARIKSLRGEQIQLDTLEERVSGVSSALANSSIDNAYNLLETSFSPVSEAEGGLNTLAVRVHQELQDITTALAGENATLLNASEHPASTPDLACYAHVKAPRPIYNGWVQYRHWRHFVGIDAKAQNGPCTSIDIHHAARALNVVLALAPVNIAIFANSPLADGQLTGLKEHRLTIWEEMFRDARFRGDLELCRLPARPFEDLGDYFRWMFGTHTVSQALPLHNGRTYKSAATACLEGDPSLEEFLHSASRQKSWRGQRCDTGEPVEIKPGTEHLAYSQFAHFLDARWRYELTSFPPLEELLAHWNQPHGIEALYERHGVVGYIEGRAPGAVLPDIQLDREAGAEIAATAPLSASAIQLGWLRNLEEAENLVQTWGWRKLQTLRGQAMRHALDDDEVFALTRDALSVARAGLSAEEQHWLKYADYVTQTRRTGADRMIELWAQYSSDLEKLCTQRAVFLR